MNRVSSRQRLVSWDAFDASAPDNDSSDEEVLSEYQTCVDDVAMMVVSPSSSWTTVGGEAMDSSSIHSMSMNSPCADLTTFGGHKRDRAARRDSSKRSSLAQLRTGMMTALGESTAVPTSPVATTYPLQFHDLAVDTQLHVMSFLDLSSLRSVMATNRTHRSLLMSKDAHFVWKDWIQNLWPKLLLNNMEGNLPWMDSMQLPTAAGQFEQHPNANVALLLSLAASRHSTTIDVDLFHPSVISYNLRSLRRHPYRQYTTAPSPLFLMYEKGNLSRNMTIVQFRGDVGVGDRCIRAKEPLARPQRRVAATASYHQYYNIDNHNSSNHHYISTSSNNFFLHGLPFRDQHHHHNQFFHPFSHALQQYQTPEPPSTTSLAHARLSLLDMICRGAKAVAVVESHQQQHPFSWHWKPFVTPHVVVNPTDGKMLLDLTPRLVSYFEVSILSDADHSDHSDISTTTSPLPRHLVRSECVAVGVASHYFDLHSRMPGWDSFSFGYHGDDGGIFHASGVMLRPYGPCFGVGDTVGCGIDYTNGGIFFTLNSKFLGYAWTGISTSLYLQQDLYPVVGVDTHAPISCNFGERPFSFDLSTFIQQHAHVIKDACCGLSTTAESSMTTTIRDMPSPTSSRVSRRRG